MTIKKNQSKYVIEHLDKTHEKRSFSCGAEELNKYLHVQSSQDKRKNASVTYVLTENNSNIVLGFYTLSSIGINAGELPEEIIKKLPRYPILPGILLGRLAVDKKSQGNKIGTFLLIDALKRSLVISGEIGITAVIVEAKNKKAAEFYKHYGFIEFPENKSKLFLPMSTIKKLFL